MEVRPGYKQAEVGVIPKEWQTDLMSSITLLPIQNGVFNEPERKGRGCKLINVINLYSYVPIETTDLERFDATRDEINRFGVNHGDLFFTRSSLTPDGIAHCNVYRRIFDEEILFDCHIIRVRLDQKKVDPFFLVRYCASRPARRYLIANAKTTTMTTIDQGVIAKMPIPLPAIHEQGAIATALSDVDALTNGLERLIAKKRDLKQAAMQQLLTGKTRLPGFHGEWEVKTLDEVCQKIQDGTHFSPKLGGNDYFYVTSKNIRLGTLDMSTAERISATEHAKIYARCDVKRGDLLLTKDGANTGNAALNSLDEPFSLLSSVAILRFDCRRYSPTFFMYQVLSKDGQEQIKEMMSGNAITRLTLVKIRKLRFAVASFQEQAAIAAVLTDMDAELTTLEQRLAKTRALKQAMMQELLTGKIRLIPREASHA